MDQVPGLSELTKLGPLGAVIVASWWAIWKLKDDLDKVWEGRRLDAKEVIGVNTTALTALTSASEARNRASEAQAKSQELAALAQAQLTAELANLRAEQVEIRREIASLRQDVLRRSTA